MVKRLFLPQHEVAVTEVNYAIRPFYPVFPASGDLLQPPALPQRTRRLNRVVALYCGTTRPKRGGGLSHLRAGTL